MNFEFDQDQDQDQGLTTNNSSVGGFESNYCKVLMVWDTRDFFHINIVGRHSLNTDFSIKSKSKFKAKHKF